MSRRIGVPAACLAAALSGLTVLPLWALPSGVATATVSVLHVAALSLAIGSMLLTARSGDAAMRRPRRLFAAALTASALGMLIGVGYILALGHIPAPSAADPVAITWVPLAVVGFLLVPTADGRPPGGLRLAADAALTTTALLFTSWLVVLGPVTAHIKGGQLATLAQVAYPVGDIFVAALVLSLLPRVRADLRDLCNCVAAGLVLVAVGDSWNAVLTAESGTTSFGWPDVPLQIGLSLMAAAAFVRPRAVLRERRESALDRNLPQLGVVLACAVGLWYVARGHHLGIVEVSLAVAMTTSMVARQALHARELVNLAENHRRAASRDALTGLASRQVFLLRLHEHLATPGRGPLALLLLDLNGFKQVNDTFGLDVGDEVLRDFAAQVQVVAGQHLLARLGADEFALLVSGEQPKEVAHGIGVRLAGDHRISSRHGAVDVRCSTGIAMGSQGDDPADVLRWVNLALIAAKASREPLVCYTTELAVAAMRHNLLLTGLAGAAGRGELSLAYQPVHRLSDGALVAAEALLRWNHPQLGPVPPDEFIPLAEDSGHIGHIGDWVLQTALSQLASWDRQGRWLGRLFVNASAEQFTPELSLRVGHALTTRGLTPARLVLEITESQIPDLRANAAIRELRTAGVQIALDDFGSGYSSFAQLVRLPVDILKLDRDFVLNSSEEPGEAVMHAVVELARSLKLSTVGEGIEDGLELQAAHRAGVELAQGYLFNRPMSADELGRLLPACLALPGPRAAQVPQSAVG